MGLHQDKDEEEFAAPVVSVSLGDTGIFRLGGRTRKGPSQVYELKSGDVFVLARDERLSYHGIDRIVPGSSDFLAEGGRFNLTLRRVTRPATALAPDQSPPSGTSSLAAVPGPRPLPSSGEAAAGFGPPLDTATSAGRKTRSPIV